MNTKMQRREVLKSMALGIGFGPLGVRGLPAGDSETTAPETTARVSSLDGVPTLVVDGRPIRTVTFETYAPRPRYYQQFANADTEVFSFSTNAAACDYGHSADTWLDESTWDYAQFEHRAAMVLAARPDALLLPRVNLGTPRWWLQRNADELERFDDGSTLPSGDNPTLPRDRAFPSLASTPWRKAIGNALERLIQHVDTSRFGPNVIGWCLAGGHTEEWYHWGCNTARLAGYSERTQRAFRNWLGRKYGRDLALQETWNDRDVTLASARVPTATERLRRGPGGFRDPASQMNVIDFYHFWNGLLPETIEYFAKVARSVSQDRHVIGAFYGYLYEFAGDPEFGHNAASRLVRSPFIDFMSVTASYFNRQAATGSDYQRSPAHSLLLHGKLWYHDNDVVSYRAKQLMADRGFSDQADWPRNLSLQLKRLGYTETPQKSQWMYRRGWGFAIAHGMHQAWFDLHDGYFDAPDLMSEIKRLNVLAADQRLWPRTSIAQILVVADESSCAYANPRSELLRRALTEPQNQLTRIGAPCDHILLDDLHRADVDRYRLVLFLNCYNVDSHQRAAISRLKRGGKHLVWFGMPGWFNGSTRSCDQMKALTGFEFHSIPGDALPARVSNGESTTHNLSADSEPPALARRAFRDWVSYYAREPAIHVAMIRNLAQKSGVHLFSTDDHVLYANQSLLVLHAAAPGKLRLRFPSVCDVVDLIGGTTWQSVSTIQLQAHHSETFLLHWNTI